MKMVIDIPENTYIATCNESMLPPDVKNVVNAITNSTPLPEGHGELIDRNDIECLKAIHDAQYGHITWSEAIKQIKNSAPTIIEADKESEKQKDINHKKCKYHLGQIITMGKNKKEYEVVDISSEPWIEFEDGSMHYGMTIKPCDGSLKDAIFLSDAQID